MELAYSTFLYSLLLSFDQLAYLINNYQIFPKLISQTFLLVNSLSLNDDAPLTLVSFLHGSASMSSCTTSFMVGRRPGMLHVHRIATRNAWIISSLNGLHNSLLSSTSEVPSLVHIFVETQWTMSRLSPNSGSIGFLPVTNSIIRTPKLYTSHLVVALDEYAYSVFGYQAIGDSVQ